MGHKGLQGVTSGYKGLQRIDYKGLQGLQRVKRGYRGLQVVTGG